MAEGGLFGHEDPELDHAIDNDDDDDDEEQEVNTTGQFQPDSASTPYHGGEEHEMQTMPYEESRLPDTSYTEETPLLGNSAQSMGKKAWNALKRIFPKSATNNDASYTPTGKLQVKIAGAGKKIYNLFTKEKPTGKVRINPNLSKEIKTALGKSIYEIEKEKQEELKQNKSLAADREKYKKVMEEKRKEITRIRSEKEALEEKDSHSEQVQKLDQ